MKIQYGVQYGRRHLHIANCSLDPEGIRGHLLIDKCLHSLLLSEMAKDNPDIVTLLDEAEELYSSLLIGEMMLESAARSDQTRDGN